MRRLLLAATLAASGAALLACNAILGLQEPVLDDTIGGDAKADAPAIDGASDGGAVQLVARRTNFIAIDSDYVYYTASLESVVGRVAKDGSSKLDLANGPAAYVGPNTVTIDATDVFWTNGYSILQCKKGGCNNSPTHVVDENAADAGTYKVVAYVPDDASTVYFASYDSGLAETTIFAVPKGVENAPVTTLVAPTDLAFCPTLGELQYSAGKLYFLCEEGPIGRVDTTTKVVETLTASSPPPSAAHMVVGGSTLYYTQFTSTGSVFSLAAAPSSPSTPIALDQINPDRVDVDQQYLYWVVLGSFNNDSAVMRCKLGQCSTSIAPMVSSQNGLIDVKSDGTSLFYSKPGLNADPSNGIYRMALQ